MSTPPTHKPKFAECLKAELFVCPKCGNTDPAGFEAQWNEHHACYGGDVYQDDYDEWYVQTDTPGDRDVTYSGLRLTCKTKGCKGEVRLTTQHDWEAGYRHEREAPQP